MSKKSLKIFEVRPTKDSDRETFRVSPKSMWRDFKWMLDNPTPGQLSVMRWHFILPDGTWSTDPQHYELLESFREAAWGMLNDGLSWGRTLKVGSSIILSVGSKSLFRWMNYRGLRSFSDLSRTEQQQYLIDLPSLIVCGDEFFGDLLSNADFEADDLLEEDSTEDSDPRDDFAQSIDRLDESQDEHDAHDRDDDHVEHDEISWNQVVNRLKIFYFIRAQAPLLAARGFGVLEAEPFNGKSLFKVARPIARYVGNRVPPLPDEVALPLLSAAIKWVEVWSTDVVELLDLQLAARHPRPERNAIEIMAARVSEKLREYRFHDGSSILDPWRVPRFGMGLDVVERTPADVLRYMFNRLRDASVCVLHYLVGIRPSEVCAIRGGINGRTGLPKCIQVKRSQSGLIELFYLKSILGKGVERPTEETWLLGCRPAGSVQLPLTVRAVILLERIMAPWRKLGALDGLIVALTNPRAFPHDGQFVERINTKTLHKTFKHFLLHEVDFSQLPDRGARGESLIEYRKSKGLCITARHGRKTFAAYILESRSSLLSAVKDHFKHLSVGTTEGAYFPQSTRMRGDINSVVTSDSVAVFMEAAKGKKFVGRMAEAIERYFSDEYFTRAKDDVELYNRIEAVVIEHDLRIFFNDYGKCLIRADPLNSRCREADGSAHILMRTPSFSVRSPSMCAGCRVFTADRSNLPFWQERHAHYTLVAAQANKDGREHEFRVHLARAQQALQLIKYLGGENV